MRTYRLKNVLYFPGFNSVGGIETFCYEMGLKYGKDFDITVVYQHGDPTMMKHIAEVCRVVRYRPGDKIICDVFIFGYGYEILDHVEAKEYIQTEPVLRQADHEAVGGGRQHHQGHPRTL